MRNPFSGARYANVAATLALVVALGGTGYAAATIGTSDIKNNAVTSPKIKDKTITQKDVKKGTINSAKLKDNGVREPDVADIKMQDLALVNGWTAYNGTRGAKFGMSADGVVHMRGGVDQAGGFNATLAVLPPAYRPDAFTYVSTNLNAGNGPARIIINPNGNVSVDVTAPATTAQAQAFTSLDGVSFVP